MSMKYYLILICSLKIVGCNTMKNVCVNLKDVCAYDKSVQIVNKFNNEQEIKSGRVLNFYFSNNPFCLDSLYDIKIYVNNKLCYKGAYQSSSKMYLPEDLKDNLPVHFSLQLKSGREEVVFSLENKSVILWRDFYKHLYIGIYMDNDNDDLIEFFPLADKISK